MKALGKIKSKYQSLVLKVWFVVDRLDALGLLGCLDGIIDPGLLAVKAFLFHLNRLLESDHLEKKEAIVEDAVETISSLIDLHRDQEYEYAIFDVTGHDFSASLPVIRVLLLGAADGLASGAEGDAAKDLMTLIRKCLEMKEPESQSTVIDFLVALSGKLSCVISDNLVSYSDIQFFSLNPPLFADFLLDHFPTLLERVLRYLLVCIYRFRLRLWTTSPW